MAEKVKIAGYVLQPGDLFKDNRGRPVLREAAAIEIYRLVRKERRGKKKRLFPFQFIGGKTVQFGSDSEGFDLEPKPYGILKLLCQKKSVTFDEIAAIVWEESDSYSCDIESAVKKIRACFTRQNIPFEIPIKNREVRLTPLKNT